MGTLSKGVGNICANSTLQYIIGNMALQRLTFHTSRPESFQSNGDAINLTCYKVWARFPLLWTKRWQAYPLPSVLSSILFSYGHERTWELTHIVLNENLAHSHKIYLYVYLSTKNLSIPLFLDETELVDWTWQQYKFLNAYEKCTNIITFRQYIYIYIYLQSIWFCICL